MSPFVVAFAAILGMVLGAIAAARLGTWEAPGSLACGACSAVTSGYLVAPRRKLAASAVVFVCGAFFVWCYFPEASFPESYGERAYQPTRLPLVMAWSAGALTWLALAGATLLRRSPSRASHTIDRAVRD
jgi:hypothetical protein